jgi:hypothetical protein
MFDTPEKLALGADASDLRQPSNASSNVWKRRAAKFKRPHGKIPGFYSSQAPQMGRPRAPE